jgi:hypothetical protein
MPGSWPARLVEAALRCYPPRWRSRHGDEAAELARQLMRDGVPARSIACSYFMGAARARLVPGPSRRLGVAAGTLLVTAAALGVPVALLSSSAPARAASVIRTRITRPGDAAGQLESLLHCSGLLGESVRQALPALESLHVKIAWQTGNGKPARRPVPAGGYYVVGGTALSTDSIAIRIAVKNPAPGGSADSRGRHC